MIELGKKYRDSISGFEGTAVARYEYLYGCVRVQLDSGKDGDVKEYVFDEQRLIDVASERDVQSEAPVGGNYPTPKR